MPSPARMFVLLPEPLPPDEVRWISFELCSTLGAGKFFASPGEGGALCVRLSPDFAPEPMEQPVSQTLGVHLRTPLYREDHTRGDWPTVRMTVEWLWAHLPNGQVWYGDGRMEALDAPRMWALNAFWLQNGRRPWTRPEGDFAGPPCGCSGVPMIPFARYDKTPRGLAKTPTWVCDGCGHRQ